MVDALIAALIVIAVGGILVLLFIKANTEMVEVELDPEDPEVKQMLEDRNRILNGILEHLGVNLSLSPEEISEACDIINEDEKHSTIKISAQDLIITLRFNWDRWFKITLFRNMEMRGKTVQKSKIFWIKKKDFSAKKFTAFLMHFKKKAYPLTSKRIEQLEENYIKIAKLLADDKNDTELRSLLIQALVDFNLQDYKKPEYANFTYVALMAYVMHNYKDDLVKALKEAQVKELK